MPSVPSNLTAGTELRVDGQIVFLPPIHGWVLVRECHPTQGRCQLALSWAVWGVGPEGRVVQYHLRGYFIPIFPSEGGRGSIIRMRPSSTSAVEVWGVGPQGRVQRYALHPGRRQSPARERSPPETVDRLA